MHQDGHSGAAKVPPYDDTDDDECADNASIDGMSEIRAIRDVRYGRYVEETVLRRGYMHVAENGDDILYKV